VLRRTCCIVLALLVLVPSLAMAQAFRCASDGETHAQCCCPGDDDAADHEHDSSPSFERSCCCERVEGIAGRSDDFTSQQRDLHPTAAPVAWVIAAPVLPTTEPARVATPGRSRAPPGSPAPLFARHCSLLL